VQEEHLRAGDHRFTCIHEPSTLRFLDRLQGIDLIEKLSPIRFTAAEERDKEFDR
jgi:hypothetical protein